MKIGLYHHVISGDQTAFLLSSPRFVIGGTHFWGHADSYMVILLLNRPYVDQKQEIKFSNGVETIFKYYTWRITNRKLRPIWLLDSWILISGKAIPVYNMARVE